MKRQPIKLERIRVAAPCKTEWRFMYGDQRVRFCGQCNLNVYNLSAMSKEEAEDLIRRTEGRLCVRFYRRKDGTILTQNCPVGIKAVKDRLLRAATAVLTLLLSFFANVSAFLWFPKQNAIAKPEQKIVEAPLIEDVFVGVIAIDEPIGVKRRSPIIKRSKTYIRRKGTASVPPQRNDVNKIEPNKK